MAITVGNQTDGTASTGAGPFTLSHNSDTDFLVTCVAYRDNADNTLAATYNSVSMTSAVLKVTSGGSVLKAQIFYLASPTAGSNTLSITTSGSIGDVLGFGCISLAGVDTSNPVDATATGGETPGSEDPRSTSITTVTTGAFIVDSISDRSANIVVGGSQTQMYLLGSGDQMAASYRLATTAGSYAMDWNPDQNTEDWAQAIAAFKAYVAPSTFVPRIIMI